MSYIFSTLSAGQFELLAQALAVKNIGPHVTVFGVGADGGREASWDGPARSAHLGQNWNGYGVLQAKQKERDTSASTSLTWIKKQIREELAEWANPKSKRDRVPEFLLFVTNVRVSSTPGGGKDELDKYVLDQARSLKLGVKDARVWEYDTITALLDDAGDIRRRFAALITAGDVLAELLDRQQEVQRSLREALELYAVKTLKDDNLLNLSQAGSVKDQGISIFDVFIDLPAVPLIGAPFDHVSDEEEEDVPRTIAKALIARADEAMTADAFEQPGSSRTVLVGGPGQGKSTVTQFLAQLYRAEFVRNSPSAKIPELKNMLASLDERLKTLGMERPRARRWPARIILTDLADSLASGRSTGVLQYLAQKVSLRSTVEVTPAALRMWQKICPWIIFIDGLDEVPASSNRQQVLDALSDFYIEIASAGADVVTVATTRPQGYSDEFDPAQHLHLQLEQLPISTALEYAQRFAEIRNGLDTESSLKVSDRLVRASKEEFTSRLFSSPLQVTILTVLLEKLGQAPRDRWRLFSQYYRVISQREQEKGGPLAELLQTYQTDVDHIHRVVGDLLHRRSEAAGETSSFLERPEFEAIIERRLVDQGHSPEGAKSLTADFLRLATDRLVFLAMLNADRVGFEIRSLQEFMAAEHIVHEKESEVIPRLTDVAVRSHWRNALLFAAGSIFAEREHLRAEIVVMCTNLDLSESRTAVLRPGARLAMDLVLDGSCLSQPVYSRPLTQLACSLIDGPLAIDVSRLATIGSAELEEMVRGHASQVSDADDSVWVNRVRALEALAERGHPLAGTDLSTVVAAAPRMVKDFVVRLAIHQRRPALANVALAEALAGSPENFLVDLPSALKAAVGSTSRNTEQIPAIVTSLSSVISRRNQSDSGGSIVVKRKPVYGFATFAVGDAADTWIPLRDAPAAGSWTLLRRLATFEAEPSTENLAGLLREASNDPAAARLLLRSGSWIVRACSEVAQAFSSHFSGGVEAESNWFDELSSAAREGDLGAPTDWEISQANFGAPLALQTVRPKTVQRTRADGATWDIPKPEDGAVPAFPMLGFNWSLTYPSTTSEVAAMILTARTFLAVSSALPASTTSRTLRHLAYFAGSILADAPRYSGGNVEGRSDAQSLFEELLEDAKSASGQPEGNFNWISLLSEKRRSELLEPALLAEIGRVRWLQLDSNSKLAQWVLDHGEDGSATVRLAAHADVSILGTGGIVVRDDEGTSWERRLNAVIRLARADVEDIRSGVLDDDVLLLANKEDNDSIGLEVLRKWVEQDSPDHGGWLASRVVEVLSADHVVDSYVFVHYLTRQANGG